MNQFGGWQYQLGEKHALVHTISLYSLLLLSQPCMDPSSLSLRLVSHMSGMEKGYSIAYSFLIFYGYR